MIGQRQIPNGPRCPKKTLTDAPSQDLQKNTTKNGLRENKREFPYKKGAQGGGKRRIQPLNGSRDERGLDGLKTGKQVLSEKVLTILPRKKQPSLEISLVGGGETKVKPKGRNASIEILTLKERPDHLLSR